MKKAEYLLPKEVLLSTGVHVGTRKRKRGLEPYFHRARTGGVYLLDLRAFCERIKVAAKFIAKFEPPSIIVVSTKEYGKTPVEKFCEMTNATPVTGRFLPGFISNPTYFKDVEPSLVIVTDPLADRQAIVEASCVGIPVIGICNSDDSLSEIDFAIPANNKRKEALAIVYWLLAREVLHERGKLPLEKDLPISIKEFIG